MANGWLKEGRAENRVAPRQGHTGDGAADRLPTRLAFTPQVPVLAFGIGPADRKSGVSADPAMADAGLRCAKTAITKL